MLRRLLAISLAITLCLVTVSCGGPTGANNGADQANRPGTAASAKKSTQLPTDGNYGVQQVTFDDGTGDYQLMLLDTAPGASSVLTIANLPMARLTPEEVSAGQKNYLKVEGGQPSLHIAEDFKIQYVHNVTETVNNPQTGQRETMVVRQEPGFWSPFAGALAGQVVGSLLFRPQYYVPPVYQPGGYLTGFGGSGSSYGQAVQRYQTRYQEPPAVERNRQVFRSTGRINAPLNNEARRSTGERDRPSGSGYGTSTLKRSNRTTTPSSRSGGFGSGRRSSAGRRR